jgi:hypothetical protein
VPVSVRQVTPLSIGQRNVSPKSPTLGSPWSESPDITALNCDNPRPISGTSTPNGGRSGIAFSAAQRAPGKSRLSALSSLCADASATPARSPGYLLPADEACAPARAWPSSSRSKARA